jgi:hypothetical protein
LGNLTTRAKTTKDTKATDSFVPFVVNDFSVNGLGLPRHVIHQQILA